MLSLVSAPVLGYDLVRHPHGDAIASVLLRALASGPADLEAFAAAQECLDPDRLSEAREQLRSANTETMFSVTAELASHRDGSSLADIITELRERMIVDLDALDGLIRDDILAWCVLGDGPAGATRDAVTPQVARAAGDAFVDAVTALWALGPSPAGSRRLLAAAFLEASHALPWRDPDIGPNGEPVRLLLRRLADISPTDRARLRAATSVLRPSSTVEWATAMHDASWAALTTGRIRAGAAAQFFAVRSFFFGGFDALDGVEGIWNVVSGGIHARVVADVLPDVYFDSLTRVWRSIFRLD
jgi:hypothetical protein